MSSLVSEFKSLYNNTPKFYKLYFITSGITYLYFPDTRKIILENTGLVLINISINTVKKIINKYYPNKEILCDITNCIDLISCIGTTSYVSYNLNILSNLHNNKILNFSHFLQKQILTFMRNTSCITSMCGVVSSFTICVASKTINLIYGRQVELFLTKIDGYVNYFLNNIVDDYVKEIVINFLKECFRKPMTETELNNIAPIRCPGMNNVIDVKFETKNCSICMDDFSCKNMHRILPCNHAFHVCCIDEWLLSKSLICPICKKDVKITRTI